MSRLMSLLVGLLAAPALFAQGLPLIELAIGIHRIEAEVAATAPARVQGLMGRKALPPQRGMLFVFDQAARHCMWMKNTPLPLAVAFLDAEGRILNIAEMQPMSEENHCAAAPARFALEMNRGWFTERGIRPGDRLMGLERLLRAP